MLSAGKLAKAINYNGGHKNMMRLLISAVFSGAGAFFPFLLVDDDVEVVSDEV